MDFRTRALVVVRSAVVWSLELLRYVIINAYSDHNINPYSLFSCCAVQSHLVDDAASLVVRAALSRSAAHGLQTPRRAIQGVDQRDYIQSRCCSCAATVRHSE